MILERDFQATILDYATALGWRAYHNARARGNLRGGPTAAGFPDLVLAKDGYPDAPARIIFAELKTGRRTTTHEQRLWLAVLGDTEGVGVWAGLWRPDDPPLGEPWMAPVETWQGEQLGAIGRRLRGEDTGTMLRDQQRKEEREDA